MIFSRTASITPLFNAKHGSRRLVVLGKIASDQMKFFYEGALKLSDGQNARLSVVVVSLGVQMGIAQIAFTSDKDLTTLVAMSSLLGIFSLFALSIYTWRVQKISDSKYSILREWEELHMPFRPLCREYTMNQSKSWFDYLLFRNLLFGLFLAQSVMYMLLPSMYKHKEELNTLIGAWIP